MNLNFLYINLTKRPERNEFFLKNWQQFGNCVRIDAIDTSQSGSGTLGCYLSHKKAFETMASAPPRHQNQKTSSIFHFPFSIFCEDDAVPCTDFTTRLQKVIQQLPQNWDVLMLGCSVTEKSKYIQISELIAKAETRVLAGHCYIVNPNFYKTFNYLHNLPEKPFNNFDVMLNYLQQNHNVYIAVPAMSYQYNSFSDNSNRLVGNTCYTETLFKDTL